MALFLGIPGTGHREGDPAEDSSGPPRAGVGSGSGFRSGKCKYRWSKGGTKVAGRQDSQKKMKAADRSVGKRVSVRRDIGLQGGLRKTHKSQIEATDKVWSLNVETEKALEVLASEQDRDPCDVDKFDAEFEEIEDTGEALEAKKCGHCHVSREPDSKH